MVIIRRRKKNPEHSAGMLEQKRSNEGRISFLEIKKSLKRTVRPMIALKENFHLSSSLKSLLLSRLSTSV
jgi:hypothetical protein